MPVQRDLSGASLSGSENYLRRAPVWSKRATTLHSSYRACRSGSTCVLISSYAHLECASIPSVNIKKPRPREVKWLIVQNHTVCNSFIQRIFIDYLLFARHCFRCWEYSSEQSRLNSFSSQSLYSSAGGGKRWPVGQGQPAACLGIYSSWVRMFYFCLIVFFVFHF